MYMLICVGISNRTTTYEIIFLARIERIKNIHKYTWIKSVEKENKFGASTYAYIDIPSSIVQVERERERERKKERGIRYT